jgi:hypothetical protein
MATEAILMAIMMTTGQKKELGPSMVINNSLDSGSTDSMMDFKMNLNS